MCQHNKDSHSGTAILDEAFQLLHCSCGLSERPAEPESSIARFYRNCIRPCAILVFTTSAHVSSATTRLGLRNSPQAPKAPKAPGTGEGKRRAIPAEPFLGGVEVLPLPKVGSTSGGRLSSRGRRRDCGRRRGRRGRRGRRRGLRSRFRSGESWRCGLHKFSRKRTVFGKRCPSPDRNGEVGVDGISGLGALKPESQRLTGLAEGGQSPANSSRLMSDSSKLVPRQNIQNRLRLSSLYLYQGNLT